MYKSTITLAMLEVLTCQGIRIGIEQQEPDVDVIPDDVSGMVTFNGPIRGDVNIYYEEHTHECCDENCEESSWDDLSGSSFDDTSDNGQSGSGNEGDNDLERCDYVQRAEQSPQSPHKDLAAELDWDMLGFITDWNRDNNQDPRITEEFVIYIYQTICCRDLNLTIDAMLSSNGFFIYELFAYQDANLSTQIINAQTERLN